MKRFAFLVLTLFLATAWPARAETYDVRVDGSIRHPNPAATYETSVIPSGGITRNLNACSGTGEYQGFDSFWIDVSQHRGHAAIAYPTVADPLRTSVDLDVFLYRADCTVLSYRGMAQGQGGQFGFGLPEDGVIPADASWALVTMWSGVPDATFAFEM